MIPAKFDSRSPEVLENPYPAYARLRSAGPLARGGVGQWVVTRHADVSALLKDKRLSHEYPPEYHEFSTGVGPANSFLQRIMLDRDPPDHTRLRQLMASAFTPRFIRRLEEFVADQVEQLLRPGLSGQPIDIVEELAFPLPVAVICELIGIPAADRMAIRPRAVDLAKAFALYVAPAEREAAHEAVAWLRRHIEDLIEARADEPPQDVLTTLLAARREDTSLSLEDIVDNVVFLFFAGFETTTNLLSTMFSALLAFPDQLELIRSDRSLISSAVEEFLRFDAPIQATARLVRHPLEIEGRQIREGRVVVLLLGSANHDEQVFPDADRLDVSRSPNPHVSFGGGVHVCLGAALARMEAKAALSWLVGNTTSLEPAGDEVRRHSVTFRSFQNLPVTMRPRLNK